MMQAITNCADQAVILPVALLAAIGLGLLGWKRAAIAWVIVVPITLGLVVVAKMAVVTCGGSWARSMDLRSPSGHTAAAVLVYGGLLAIVLPARMPWLRAACLLAVGLAVGVSRVALHFHTIADVVAGAVLGLAGAGAFIAVTRSRSRGRAPGLLLAGVACLAFVLHGQRLHAEDRLGTLAFRVWPFSACHR